LFFLNSNIFIFFFTYNSKYPSSGSSHALYISYIVWIYMNFPYLQNSNICKFSIFTTFQHLHNILKNSKLQNLQNHDSCFPFIHSSCYWSIHPSNHSSTHPSNHPPSFHPSIYLFTHSSRHLTIYPSNQLISQPTTNSYI